MRMLWLLLLPLDLLAAALPERPRNLGLCAACHGEDGRGRLPGQPHLGGQDVDYLRSALQQYRDGGRSDSVMRAMAGSLSPKDVDALARWYAAQPGACACAGELP